METRLFAGTTSVDMYPTGHMSATPIWPTEATALETDDSETLSFLEGAYRLQIDPPDTTTSVSRTMSQSSLWTVMVACSVSRR